MELLGIHAAAEISRALPDTAVVMLTISRNDDDLFDALRAWRKGEAEQQGVPAYVIFHNAALDAIAAARPRDAEDLAMIPGVGRNKLERYADAVLRVVREHAG